MNNKIREAIALYVSKTSNVEVSEVIQANKVTVTKDKIMFIGYYGISNNILPYRCMVGFKSRYTEQFNSGALIPIDTVVEIKEEDIKYITINNNQIIKIYDIRKNGIKIEDLNTKEYIPYITNSKRLNMGFNTQGLEIAHNNETHIIKMPWCLTSCIEGIISRGKELGQIKSINTAKIYRKTDWSLIDGIKYDENKVIKFSGCDAANAFNNIVDEFGLGNTSEYTTVQDYIFNEYYEYMEHILSVLNIDSDLSNANVVRGLTDLVKSIGRSSSIYTNAKSLRARGLKSDIDSNKDTILYMEAPDVLEDSNHAILLEGYDNEYIWALDSNGRDKEHGLVLAWAIPTEALVLSYSASIIYKLTGKQCVLPKVLNNQLETIDEEAPIHINNGKPLSIKFNQLPGYSVGIMGNLGLPEVNKLEVEQSEYCALAIMYRFLEFSDINKITISVPDLLHIEPDIKDSSTLNRWDRISKLPKLRGYGVSLSEILSISKIKNNLDGNIYMIMLFEGVGTYSLVCIDYTPDNLICYHLVAGIITPILIPIKSYKTIQIGFSTYSYTKTIVGFTRTI